MKLFEPLKIGTIEIKNRIVMAPLTRCRAPGRVPNDLMVEYYSQRASAGLIITEATAITAKAVGYPDTPGIWSQEQIEGWKKITSAVHAKGSKIVMQLWHVGRISHSLYLDGELPVAPSAIKPDGRVRLVRPERDYETPRALEVSEIKSIVEDYRKAALNAQMAGFDGVELHAANGYLVDQFLQDKTNRRTDEYGGSIENRSKFLLEVTEALVDVWGADKVGVHLAPRGLSHDISDSNPKALFTYVAKELGKRKIAFIFNREFEGEDSIGAEIKKAFGGVVIANDRFTKDSAEKIISSGEADAVAFGMMYISNPDLVERMASSKPLNQVVQETIYAQGAAGYTDYPVGN